MHIKLVGIDLAKTIFHLHGVDSHGNVIFRKKLTRAQVPLFLTNLPKCRVAMEACGGSNYWAREIQKMGHEVKLIPAQFVKPFVKTNKNDRVDAEAICEAAARPNMRFVPVKSVDQQDLQSLHRVRSRIIRTRTALVNEIRGLLHENGIVISKTIGQVRKKLPLIISATDPKFTSMFLEMLRGFYEELLWIDKRVSKLDDQIRAIHAAHPVCRRLGEIPGIGPITATALVASSHPGEFTCGRQYSAWIGLVPKQHSTGGKERLLGISKRGDVYLRTLLIHGARSALRAIQNKNDLRSLWAKKLIERRGMNKAAVAFANKNARTVWAMLMTEKPYCERVAA
jgi:transposase